MESEIVYDYINEYIRKTTKQLDGELLNIQQEATKNEVPIIKQEVISLISVLLSMKKPKNILEIGAAVGFSAILMSKFLQQGGKIFTIERNPKMQEKAKENIKKMNLQDKIVLLEGDAEEILPTINEKVDVIFMDAAKSKYEDFLELSKNMLNQGGIIIADNILHKGMVAKKKEDVVHRQRTIYNKMRIFLEKMANDESFETTILPVSDGIMISYKK